MMTCLYIACRIRRENWMRCGVEKLLMTLKCFHKTHLVGRQEGSVYVTKPKSVFTFASNQQMCRQFFKKL